MNKIYAQSHGTFHAYQKKHGSKFTLTILALCLAPYIAQSPDRRGL